MQRNVPLCLILLTCVPSFRVISQDMLADNQNMVLTALKHIGYLQVPKDENGWHQAFASLAKKYSDDADRYQNEIKLHKIEISLHKNNTAQCETNLQRQKNETIKCENDGLKYKSVLKVRSELLEDVERYFHTEHVFPDKKKMLEELTGPLHKYTGPLFYDEKCVKQIKGLPPYADIHTVTWLYYLAFCDSATAFSIRKELSDNQITVFKFCDVVGTIFRKVSSVIHQTVDIENLQPQRVLEGLTLYGIKGNTTLTAVSVLMKIPQFTTLYNPTSTTLNV